MVELGRGRAAAALAAASEALVDSDEHGLLLSAWQSSALAARAAAATGDQQQSQLFQRQLPKRQSRLAEAWGQPTLDERLIAPDQFQPPKRSLDLKGSAQTLQGSSQRRHE
jgi:hypothetical protein